MFSEKIAFLERYHQNSQRVLAAKEINGLRSLARENMPYLQHRGWRLKIPCFRTENHMTAYSSKLKRMSSPVDSEEV